jgi:catechol 2,3-dioxygenase-like lactoylglutathione lyase family enzyme
MGIKGVAHVCYTVRDLEVATEFYCGKLGLKRAFDFINDQGERFGVYIHAGERTFVELFKGELGPPAKGQAYRHLCLEVDDLAATVDELRSRGVQTSAPRLGSDHSWQSWIQDPDGNRIELHQYTPESKQTPWVG